MPDDGVMLTEGVVVLLVTMMPLVVAQPFDPVTVTV